MTKLRLVCLVLLAVGLAGCSGGSSGGAAGSGATPGTTAGGGAAASGGSDERNVCTLLSNEQLTSILGKPIVSSKGFATGNDPACMWYDEETFDSVQVILLDPEDFESGKAVYTPMPVSGLGQEAYMSKFGVVYVKTAKGDLFAQSAFPVGDGKISSAVRAAAAAASGNELAKYEASYRIAQLLIGKL